MFNSDNLPHELFLDKQRTKQITRGAIENNLSADIKLSKAQIKKIIMSGGNLGALLSKFAGLAMEIDRRLKKNL